MTRIERGGRWIWVAFDRSPNLPFRVSLAELEVPVEPPRETAGFQPPPMDLGDRPPTGTEIERQPRPEPAPRPASKSRRTATKAVATPEVATTAPPGRMPEPVTVPEPAAVRKRAPKTGVARQPAPEPEPSSRPEPEPPAVSASQPARAIEPAHRRVSKPEPAPEPPSPPLPVIGPEPSSALSPTTRDALVLLESLRLGTVPHVGLDSYTVGRDRELAAVLSMLQPEPGPGGRFRIVIGHYGTGKTHLMECIRQQALALGHAVASATLDSIEVTPAHPRRIYRMLMHSLTLPGERESGSLVSLFNRLLASGYRPRPSTHAKAHRYLDPALLYYAGLADQPELRDLLMDWIEGQPGELSDTLNEVLRRRLPGAPRLLALPDYRTFASIYAYVLGGIACLCRQAGAQGLCLLIDEAEFYAALGAQDRPHAINVLGSYALACLGEHEVRQGEEQLYKGGQEIHRAIPLRYSPDQPLSSVWFLTPDPKGLDALGTWVDLPRHLVELSPLRTEDYSEIYRRVYRIYGEAHPGFYLPDQLAAPMGQFLESALLVGILANPRALLKLVVEILDLYRLAPHHLMAVLDDLTRIFED